VGTNSGKTTGGESGVYSAKNTQHMRGIRLGRPERKGKKLGVILSPKGYKGNEGVKSKEIFPTKGGKEKGVSKAEFQGVKNTGKGLQGGWENPQTGEGPREKSS